jgi:hypothetical protein
MDIKAFVWAYPLKINGLRQTEGADDAVLALPRCKPAGENTQIQDAAKPAHPPMLPGRQRRVKQTSHLALVIRLNLPRTNK